jgi:peptide chain release factor 3
LYGSGPTSVELEAAPLPRDRRLVAGPGHPVQIFQPLDGSAAILGAVGQLQVEVVVYRLAHEYGAEVRLTPVSYYGARWVSGDPAELDRLIAAYPDLVARDGAGVLAFLAPGKIELEVRQKRFDKIRFHTQREYSGLEEEAPA